MFRRRVHQKPRGSNDAIASGVLLTALVLVFAIALLIKETAYLFAAFMILGPALLLAAAALLGWHILAELRAKRVL